MYNLLTKFIKILGIYKLFLENLVNNHGNILCSGLISKFSDLEVMALSLATETGGVIFHL